MRKKLYNNNTIKNQKDLWKVGRYVTLHAKVRQSQLNLCFSIIVNNLQMKFQSLKVK